MPVDNIPITRTAPQATQLLNLVNLIYSARGIARQILEQMQQQSNPGGSVYTNIETQFGIPSGSGGTVYSLTFALANGASNGSGLENSAITAFCSQLN